MDVRSMHRLLTHRLFLIGLFTLFYIALLPFYYNKFLTFGCFDDCFNYLGGYFMLQGKTIFSEFFYNHQPFMAYISMAIQYVTDPQGIYHLVLYHRLFTYGTSLILGALLIYRFKAAGFGMLLLYESTKYYVFGDRFLAEGIIVYLLAYVFGLVFLSFTKQTVHRLDYVLLVLFTWIVFFMREPFIPLALVLFVTLLWRMPSFRQRLYYGLSLVILSLVTVSLFPPSEYFFNVFYINSVASLSEQGFSLASPFFIFFYPVAALFSPIDTLLSGLLWGMSLLFIILSAMFLYKTKRFIFYGFLLFLLGLGNLRYTSPGVMYYEAFHMIVWYGMFLLMLFLLLDFLVNQTKNRRLFRFSIVYIAFLLVVVFSQHSFYWSKNDLQTDFVTHFGQYVSSGEVVKILSERDTTLFLDGFDDMVYYHAGVLSEYQYTWFTSLMPRFGRYMDARSEMFATNPPDFYYGSCGYLDALTLPQSLENQYERFYVGDNPTCLHIKSSYIQTITDEEKERLKNTGYYLKSM